MPQSYVRLARFGPYVADFVQGELRKHGTKLKIQSKPLSVLQILVQKRGEIVTREELRGALWQSDVFVDFDKNLATAVNKLRSVLGDSAEEPRYIETIPRRGYRFLVPVDTEAKGTPETVPTSQPLSVPGTAGSATSTEGAAKPVADSSRFRWQAAVSATVLISGLAAGGWLFFSHKTHALTDKDTIVLADFANGTNEAIFDDTLKTALTVSLRQSPFLNALPDSEVAKTLQMMTRPADTKLTPEVAREVCQRTGSKAYVAGAIGSLGSEYVLGVIAVNCQSGNTLAQQQVTAATKEKVLDALREAATKLRRELGESLESVQRFDVPMEQATTPSLGALKAYSIGITTAGTKGDSAASPYFKRALELDTNFALAYADLGVSYTNLGQASLAAENLKKAYALRGRVSEREKYKIESLYYSLVTGDEEQAIQVYELWEKSYPQDVTPHVNLGWIYSFFGQYEKAVTETEDSLRLTPNDVMGYVNLGSEYLALNRSDDARKTIWQAQQQKLDGELLHWLVYQVAFVKGDIAEMEGQMAWAAGKPGVEDLLLTSQSDTEAYYGRLAKARGLSRRAVDSAVRSGSKETGALWQMNAGLREAEFGNLQIAKQDTAAALALSPDGRTVRVLAALALARVGEIARAKSIVAELEKSYPSDTILKVYSLPIIKAAMELHANNPRQSVAFLEAAAPYELGAPPLMQVGTMYPVYIRGQAQLLAHDTAAITEFQKLLANTGVTLNYPLGALAHLGLARAYALQGDTGKAKDAYQHYLALWKDADPDIPILKQAKAEYAKLQ
jgi:DNA-binding winged helix-turn-helix (wHTH) protein/tetratricopeptide (TPR) repeat protein